MKNYVNFISILVFSFIVIALLVSLPLNAKDFVKGQHYKVLSMPLNEHKGNKKQVTEFFSFYCPGCFRFESVVEQLKKKLPANITFNKNHIEGMPGRDITIEQSLSKALLTANLLQVEEKVSAAIFNYIHVKKAIFNNDKDIENLFRLQGIDGESFNKVFNSFTVKTGVKKMHKQITTLRNQQITKVPTVIVNGKYKVEASAISSPQEYIALVLYLLAL